jgi:hypothetical protein
MLADEVSTAARAQSSAPSVRCREIMPADVEAVVRLLARGFPARSPAEWSRALARLAAHATPPGFPKYGYLLEHEGAPKGVLLLIFSAVPMGSGTKIRCNVSSWYTEPAFRGHAALLASRALKHGDVTYINITPAPHTLPILEAQNYRRYASGVFLAAPALAAGPPGSRVAAARPGLRPGADLPQGEVDLLFAHAGYGCLSLVCSEAGRRHPFVFVRRKRHGWIPYAHLVYCRGIDEFVRFAGPLGRHLAWRGAPLVALDANGPVAGLIGRYAETASPRCFRGPERPRLGDLAFSERAMFGF